MFGSPTQLTLAALILATQAITLPCHAAPPGYQSDTRAYNLAHGRVVFADKCMGCHESGRKGAPVVDDLDDWEERLEQPLDTLIEHAINGHGRMPAKGDTDISNPDVAAAVAYVVNRTRALAAGQGKNIQSASAVSTLANPSGETTDQAVVHMFLMLLGKDRWK